jgi:hypothetical protein
MIERAYRFGKQECLTGVVTEPHSGSNRNVQTAVLTLNAGLLHRVGPHRLHVDLARRLARQGVVVLRFDISGIGDSEMRGDKLPYEKRAIADIRDAMDFMETKWDCKDFVLIGLCSGAEQAHFAAVEDERVSGAVLMDGYGYRTGRFYVQHFMQRGLDLFRLRKWKNLLRQGMKRNWSRGTIFNREFPPRESMESDLVRLLERRVNLLYFYSGDAKRYYNYERQFHDMFKGIDSREGLQIEYLRQADHTYTLLEDREELISLISEWMATHYG